MHTLKPRTVKTGGRSFVALLFPLEEEGYKEGRKDNGVFRSELRWYVLVKKVISFCTKKQLIDEHLIFKMIPLQRIDYQIPVHRLIPSILKLILKIIRFSNF